MIATKGTKAAFVLTILACLALANPHKGFAQPTSYPPGEKVLVEYSGSWYEAVILKAVKNGWLIHYTEYDSSWDEVVGADRVKPVAAKSEAADLGSGAIQGGGALSETPSPSVGFGAGAGPAAAVGSGEGATANSGAGASASLGPGAHRASDGGVYYDPREITLFKSGKTIGRIESTGKAYLGEREVGRFDWNQSGLTTARGKEWEITARGEIKSAGKLLGSFDADGTLRVGRRIAAKIEYGSVFIGEKEWGEASLYDGSSPDTTPVALFLAAFFPEFGFPGAESR